MGGLLWGADAVLLSPPVLRTHSSLEPIADKRVRKTYVSWLYEQPVGHGANFLSLDRVGLSPTPNIQHFNIWSHMGTVTIFIMFISRLYAVVMKILSRRD